MNTSEPVPTKSSPSWKMVLIVGLLATGLTFGVTALLMNILERKQEAKHPFFRVVELDESIDDPSVWGKNFPLQYDDYLRTTDMVRTRFGGSEAVPRTPDDSDPRLLTSRSLLEAIPDLKRMWAGYAFALDFREARGHAYMLDDQTYTGRQAVSQPGTCLHCHASVVTAMRTLGNGDLQHGFEALNQLPFAEARQQVRHPVSCIDCHDPQTMALRITRPAFVAGIRDFKASQGIEGYDVHTMATRQEMRSFVCAQCHVEYYFQGTEKRLVFPWSQGLKVDDILAYYDEREHRDWIHAETDAPLLKAQHPEFELWSMGTHAAAGVSCADCHMPYKRVGALKISDHHVRSPLLNINNACQSCHKRPEEELRQRVFTIQERHERLVKDALGALVDLIDDLSKLPDTVSEAELDQARQLQRKASFFVDFVEAENSSGFHAPQESARILAEAINAARQGQLIVRGWSRTSPAHPATQTEPQSSIEPSKE